MTDEATTRSLSDEDIQTVMPGSASVAQERPRDADDTDCDAKDGTDGDAKDGTDGDAKDGTDSQDADGTDATDADGTDRPS